jgi:hypothetical protein
MQGKYLDFMGQVGTAMRRDVWRYEPGGPDRMTALKRKHV